MSEKVDEAQGKDEVVVKEGQKPPETVTWTQYVGIKEKLGKEKETLQHRVTELEEQVKQAPNQDQVKATQEAYDKLKAEHEVVKGEVNKVVEQRVNQKREDLKAKGIPDEQVKEASEEQLDLMLKTVGVIKPKPDMGGGTMAATGEVSKDPMSLAISAYNTKGGK